jgi:uncharacterized membrane protein
MNILVFILTTSSIGILCAIPTIIVGRLLANRGMAREMPGWVIVGTTCTLFAWRLLFPEASLECFAATGAVILPFGVYRHDLWTYFRRRKLPNDDN